MNMYFCRNRKILKNDNMTITLKYRENDSMSELISTHYNVLLVMSRFGLSLGFGDKSIGEVCRENNVDTSTFLAVVNMLLDEDRPIDLDNMHISLESLVSYLHSSHEYFLEYRLPAIRKDLVEALKTDNSDLSKAIILYFDEYAGEVRKHMTYEEKNVFPYIRDLMAGKKNAKYNIGIFSRQHDQVESRLTEFKNILIKYLPTRSANEINNVLFEIFLCESDLASHNAVEDRLLVPLIERLESKFNG